MAISYFTRIVTATPYFISGSDEIILVNVNGIASVVLPIINGSDKRAYIIKDQSGLSKENPIKITALGNKTIDGMPFAILNSGYSHIQVVYDGTNWKTIA